MFLRSQGSNLGVWVERGRQLINEVLRKRAAPKAGRTVPNESQQQSRNVNLIIAKENLHQDIGYGIFARFTKTFNTQAAVLRRSATMRMIGSSRHNLLGFTFVGLALANEETGGERASRIAVLPLDVCCQVIKSSFQKNLVTSSESDFPSDIASYDLCPHQLLGQGCNASIYAAKLKNHQFSPAKISSHSGDLSIDSTDDLSDDGGDYEMVAMDTTMQCSDDDSLCSEESDFVILNAEHDRQDKLPKSEEDYDLAIKMMFNYDVMSNALAISQAFQREYLPLQQVPDDMQQTNMLRWRNGNHVKKRCDLPVHPNIVAMYHAFASPVKVHDLMEAKELFPAALPMRMHMEGLGRNMTMFIVMKRYDMTLTEYSRSIGCQSQHVAMVIVAQLLEGVSHLVANGIAHRDLKGNNILVNLDPDGGSPHVVLADFGCCLADSDVSLVLPYSSSMTDIGGNTALMAPEVKLAIPGPSSFIDYSKSDAWAIGAIAYEVLGMGNPFYRHGDNKLDSALYEYNDLPVLPDTTHPGLARVIALLLMKDANKRPTPQVAADMLHLSLWQPNYWKNACLESGHLLPTQDHITNWLLQVSMAMMIDSDEVTPREAVLWLNGAECRLCETWLSRVEDSPLMNATLYLHGIQPSQ